MDDSIKKEVAEIVTWVVRQEMKSLRTEIAYAVVEALNQFGVDLAKALARENVYHFKKLAQDVYGPRARAYEVRTSDAELRRQRREDEFEVALEPDNGKENL